MPYVLFRVATLAIDSSYCRFNQVGMHRYCMNKPFLLPCAANLSKASVAEKKDSHPNLANLLANPAAISHIISLVKGRDRFPCRTGWPVTVPSIPGPIFPHMTISQPTGLLVVAYVCSFLLRISRRTSLLGL